MNRFFFFAMILVINGVVMATKHHNFEGAAMYFASAWIVLAVEGVLDEPVRS
jgi:hypothetical protein